MAEKDSRFWKEDINLGNCMEDDEQDVFSILELCRGMPIPSHLRTKAWKILLKANDVGCASPTMLHVFDLPEQSVIRTSCRKFVDTLTNSEDEKISILSDVESVLTAQCKETSIVFKEDNRWLDLLKPLVTLKLCVSELFECFHVISRDYIPRDSDIEDGLPYQILRLLLLYHEPKVCNFLESKRISMGSFSQNWFKSLLSSSCDLDATISLWDIYFQLQNPFLIFHMALAIIVNSKDYLLNLPSNSEKFEIIEYIESLPKALKSEDVSDFISIAQHYADSTPKSYEDLFGASLFGKDSCIELGFRPKRKYSAPSPTRRVAMCSLCLPVCANELVNSVTDVGYDTRFFLVDCRPHFQYNAGHLSTAFHLDCSLLLDAPSSFDTAVQGLLLTQKESLSVASASAGDHLCFLGSGREEEDQYLNMVVSSFLQKHIPKVCLLSGGYQALHDFLDSSDALVNGSFLVDHNHSACVECQIRIDKDNSCSSSNKGSKKAWLNSVSNLVKEKSSVIKDKLTQAIKLPFDAGEVHVSEKAFGKPYRGTNLFALNLDEDEEAEEELTEIRKNAIGIFDCSEVFADGSSNRGELIVSGEKLYFLSCNRVRLDQSLSEILKITSKKKHPQLITFKFGIESSEYIDSRRFYLHSENYKELVQLVKESYNQSKDSSM